MGQGTQQVCDNLFFIKSKDTNQNMYIYKLKKIQLNISKNVDKLCFVKSLSYFSSEVIFKVFLV